MKNEKGHIGFFIPSLRGGGAERAFVHLANEFADRGYKVDLVLAQKEGPYLKDVSKKVNLVDLKASRMIKSLLPLTKYLKREKPHILISGLSHCNLISIWAKYFSRTSFKVFINEQNHFSMAIKEEKCLGRSLIPFLAYLFYKKADHIIVLSEGIKEDLIKTLKIPEEKIKMIYNPIFNPSILVKAKQEVNHPYFQNKNDKVILGVGRLTKQKDFATLIKAFSKLRETQKVRLIILGEGEKRRELEELIRRYKIENNVSLPGFVENPFAYMAKANLFVLSSLYEGFGNVLVEAMACGVSVVSTDCPSGPSEILDKGKYGKLVPVGNIEKLAKVMKEMLENPTDKDALRERAKVFSHQNVVEKYIELINEIENKKSL